MGSRSAIRLSSYVSGLLSFKVVDFVKRRHGARAGRRGRYAVSTSSSSKKSATSTQQRTAHLEQSIPASLHPAPKPSFPIDQAREMRRIAMQFFAFPVPIRR